MKDKEYLKVINSILKTLKINKRKIENLQIGWKNINKEEPQIISISSNGECEREKVEYLKIQFYLRYPLKGL